MTHRPTTLERAFELARSGDYATVGAIKAQLKAERCHDVEGQLFGRSVQTTLRTLCAASRATAARG